MLTLSRLFPLYIFIFNDKTGDRGRPLGFSAAGEEKGVPVKKFIPAPAVVAASAGSGFFGILWLNNLVSAWRYHVMLAEGDTFSGTFPPGLWPALSWSAVDASTVTTWIPFFGFLLILHGLLRVDGRAEWPFFPGYERLNIALGLLGTIWGIILVGYYPDDQINVSALIRCCLHTAMFSTLAAVAWVMVVLPAAVMPVMHLCRKLHGGIDPGIDSLGELADEFTRNVGRAGEALESGAAAMQRFRTETAGGIESLRSFRTEFSGCSAEVAARRQSEHAWMEQAAAVARDFAAAGKQIAGLQQELTEANQKLADRNAELEKKNLELDGEQRKLADANRQLADRNAALETENAALSERSRSLAGELAEAEKSVAELRRTVEEIRRALR